MDLRKYLIKTRDGVFTVTNLIVEERVVYRAKATSENNRRGELGYLGYFQPGSNYHFSPDFKTVTQYCLIGVNGKSKEVVMTVASLKEGRGIIRVVWDELITNPTRPMIDLEQCRIDYESSSYAF